MNKLISLFIAGLILLCSSACWAELIGHWSFNDQDNPGRDDSGNGHDGTVYGASWIPDGMICGALCFDGVEDYVEVAHSENLNSTNNIKISAMIIAYSLPNGSTAATKVSQIVTKHEHSAYGMYLKPTGEIDFAIFIDDAYRHAISAPIELNKLYHVIGTYDGNFVRIFANGEETVGDAITGNITTNDMPVLIGANPQPGNSQFQFFHGCIDEVYIIPEPGTVLLLGLGGLLLRRKHR